MNRTTMSPASAVHLVAAWIEAHDRAPTRRDCRKANGLPHPTTLQYVCGGVTAAIALAYASLAAGSAALSGCEGSATSACVCGVRMTSCLRCSRHIVWEGPQVRLCAVCRKAPVEDEIVGVVHWAGMRQRWPVDDWDDLVDWGG
mgnify:FL=1